METPQDYCCTQPQGPIRPATHSFNTYTLLNRKSWKAYIHTHIHFIYPFTYTQLYFHTALPLLIKTPYEHSLLLKSRPKSGASPPSNNHEYDTAPVTLYHIPQIK